MEILFGNGLGTTMYCNESSGHSSFEWNFCLVKKRWAGGRHERNSVPGYEMKVESNPELLKASRIAQIHEFTIDYLALCAQGTAFNKTQRRMFTFT